jgi:hypothetical protein
LSLPFLSQGEPRGLIKNIQPGAPLPAGAVRKSATPLPRHVFTRTRSSYSPYRPASPGKRVSPKKPDESEPAAVRRRAGTAAGPVQSLAKKIAQQRLKAATKTAASRGPLNGDSTGGSLGVASGLRNPTRLLARLILDTRYLHNRFLSQLDFFVFFAKNIIGVIMYSFHFSYFNFIILSPFNHIVNSFMTIF